MTRQRIPSLRTLTAVAAVACAALLIAGCGSGSGGSGGSTGGSATQSSGAATATAPNTIVMKNFMFTPMALTVSPGATITVKNEDSATHTVTASDKSFDSGDVSPGSSKTFTAPTKPGSYSYICTIHNYMQGTLTVN